MFSISIPLPSVSVAFWNVPSFLPINNSPLENPVDTLFIDCVFAEIVTFNVLLKSSISLTTSLLNVEILSVIVLNVREDKSEISLATLLSNVTIAVDNVACLVLSLPDRSATFDTSEVTVSPLKSVTKSCNSFNVSNAGPAPPITADKS